MGKQPRKGVEKRGGFLKDGWWLQVDGIFLEKAKLFSRICAICLGCEQKMRVLIGLFGK